MFCLKVSHAQAWVKAGLRYYVFMCVALVGLALCTLSYSDRMMLVRMLDLLTLAVDIDICRPMGARRMLGGVESAVQSGTLGGMGE